MQRKLIRQGSGAGYTIYLPKKWVDSHGLGAGETVEVDEEGSRIVISLPDKGRERRTTTLSFAEQDWHAGQPERYVQRMLATAYKQGADTILVRCTSPQILDYIERRVDSLIGIEIIDQRQGTLVIKSLAEGLEMEFENVLSRITLLAEHLSKEAAKAISARDPQAIDNLLRLERTHNKFTDFAKRLLAGKRGAAREDKYLYAYILENERLVDEYKHILRAAKDAAPDPRSLEFLEEVNAYLQVLFGILRTQRPEDIRLLAENYAALRERADELLAEGKDARLRSHLHHLVFRIYELGETVLEWKLQ